jgi:hypothetical protein
MKSTTRSNGKKINLKRKDLKAKKDPQGGGGTHLGTMPGQGRPSPDGLGRNHNEMFVEDVD